MNGYKRIKRELEHKGVVVDFYSDYMELPNGNTVRWDFIDHKGAAAIVPVDDEGKIIMVRQVRSAVDRETLEIPAGGINKGEDLRTCAIRELEEETGYRSEDVGHLLDFYTTVAYCNEKIEIYYAHNLIPSKQHLDEDEFIRIERYTIEELIEMIFKGEIIDGKTIAGIFAYKEKKSRGFNI